MTRLRLVFMGSPAFALPTLDALLAAGHEIACVYTQPPRPAGRGHKERPSPVHALALEKGLKVRTPVTMKDAAEEQAFAALQADADVVVAYGLMLPPAVLEAPRLGCLNLHASLLPRGRGAAPIQHAILAGDAETGVTVMRITEKLDSGPVLLSERVPITAETTARSLEHDLAGLGARLMVDALDGLDKGTLRPEPQAAEGATYAAKLHSDDGRLDWRRPAAELERRVRALDPWPGAWFALPGDRGVRVKVLAAEVAGDDTTEEPGTVVDGALGVATGEGVLRLTRVQRAGKAPQEARAFLRGTPVPAGTRLA